MVPPPRPQGSDSAQEYAAEQAQLGLQYMGSRIGDRGTNLARAIDSYTQALQFYRADTAPREYALTQNQMGIAYAKLSTGDRAANLERAIHCDSAWLAYLVLAVPIATVATDRRGL